MKKGFLVLGAAALMGLAGCEAGMKIDPPSGGGNQETAQRAAFAATARYPGGAQPSAEQPLVFSMDKDGGDLRLMNPSNRPLTDANVWINGQYVQLVPSVPANGVVTLRRNEFYDAQGQNLQNAKATVERVEVQAGGQTIRASGPVYQ